MKQLNQRLKLANQIYNAIETTIANNPGQAFQKEFRSICRSFPAMVHVNGLAMSIAFLQSKEKKDPPNAHSSLLSNLSLVIGDYVSVAPVGIRDGRWNGINTMYVRDYQLLTHQVMEISDWFKRYSDALIKTDEEK